jgi:hypothetical protein
LVGSCTPSLLQQAEMKFTWCAERRLLNIAHISGSIQFDFDDCRNSEDCRSL